MTPADTLLLIAGILFHVLMTEHNSALSDPVNYGILLVSIGIFLVSILTVLVTVGIAASQRRDLRRYRRTEQEAKEKSDKKEGERRARLARRESWEPVFREMQGTLTKIEDIESEVRQQGPLTRKAIDVVELGRLQRRLENVAERCPEALGDPLRNVANAIASLRSIDILSDAEVIEKYTDALTGDHPGNLPPEIWPSALGSRAIEQYKAAAALHTKIHEALQAIETERGGAG